MRSSTNVLKILLVAAFVVVLVGPAFAQTEPVAIPDAGISQDELQRLAAEAAQGPAAPDPDRMAQGSINFLNLLLQGGWLMIPIAMMSLLVVTVALERFFALRKGAVYPRRLQREIKKAVEDTSPASPQTLFDASERYPSRAAIVLQHVLQKVGRPIPELETSITEGVEREADLLYGNVRWLTLAAAVTPLIGLLGTVWGMIIAFYNTKNLAAGINKADFLAEGIYIALVTTLGGLAVAIPAAIFAHYFEGKITRMLGQIEKDLQNLVLRFEAHEGKSRYDLSSRGLTRRVVEETRKRRAEIPGPTPPPARPPATRT